MDTQRLIMFVVFSFSVLMLWDAWQKEQHPQPAQTAPTTVTASQNSVPVPGAGTPDSLHATAPEMPQHLPRGERIKVRTDALYVEIDTIGGDIRRLDLRKHKGDEDKSKDFVLFSDQKPSTYIAQSGLIGNVLPSHKTLFSAQGSEFSLPSGAQDLKIRLTAPSSAGVQVDKIFTFHRDSYVVDVEYQIRNGGESAISPHAYYQLVRDDSASKGDSMFISTYAGPAIFTDQQKFQKISFSDIEKGKATHQKQSNDGWVAMLQHYFVSAWLPANGSAREFYTKSMGENLYAAGVILPIGSIAPGASGKISVPLYAGPQEQENLSKLAPGLDLAVDYGWLTIIAAPLFWVLSKIHGMVNNWGIAIILLTVLIKLAFYPLAAKSYRSMAHMRVLGPKLQKLKEHYGDDRQRLAPGDDGSLQDRESEPSGRLFAGGGTNPGIHRSLLGIACQRRNTPCTFWPVDSGLVCGSIPYYVLPIIMGITMIIQTRLNPTPPDPIQAKVMMVMPFAFSIFFFFFPAGLVLYWVVNNVLSIAQQWQITRSMEQMHAAKGHGKN